MIRFTSKKGQTFLIVGFMMLFMITFCGLAIASGGEGASDSHAHDQMMNLLYRILNFTLLVIILVVIVKKTSMLRFFGERREEIKEKFEALTKERQTAESRSRELEKKLEEFEIQKKEILEQFRAEGAKEKARIISEARERAAQLIIQADHTIEREIQGATERLKQEVVQMAALRAEEIIAKGIKDSDQDHLVDEFIKSVEKLH
jgi:F-type H+-transporting ATPase subunit b